MKDIIDEQVKNYMNEAEAECGDCKIVCVRMNDSLNLFL